ncbi:methyl-accepting chemotaxis protein [Clostridium sartagoforme]|uniref:Methyl-accepting chemotaxis protein n=2 Tax=Clostridium sartagoforme TaxID=84031 RepID=A0A4S2DTK9_9CLOT|nr:methyl-accepting chemotaxis protein [Clostridium sartagoforme]
MIILLAINIFIFNRILASITDDVLTKGKNIKGSISTVDLEVVLENKSTVGYDYKKLKSDLTNAKSNEAVNYAAILAENSQGKIEILLDSQANLLNLGKEEAINSTLKIAMEGEVSHVREKLEGKDIIKVYYPIKDTSGNVSAVLEIYSDVTNIINIRNIVMIQLLILAVSLILVYILMSFLLSRSINKGVKGIINGLVTMSKGDLTEEVNIKNQDELGLIAKYINELQKNISEMICKILNLSKKEFEEIDQLSKSSGDMAVSSEEVTATIQEIDSNIIIQNEDSKKINNFLEKFGELIQDVKNSINNINSNLSIIKNKLSLNNKDLITLNDSKNDIENSSKTMNEKINDLYNSIEKIKEITNFIDSMADQTNLLALNAAIEAARVGEEGKGFAVVANEIRKLAEDVKKSSYSIDGVLSNISIEGQEVINITEVLNTKLSKQFSVIDDSVISFNGIVGEILDLTQKISNVNGKMDKVLEERNYIFASVSKSSELLDDISKSSEEIKNLSLGLSIMAQGIAEIAEILNNNTNNKNTVLSVFKTK